MAAEAPVLSRPVSVSPSKEERWARLFSILGHPGLVVPFCAACAMSRGGRSYEQGLKGIGVLLGMVLLVAAYTGWRVRSGKWSHVDAVRREDRKDLNVFLFVLLSGVGIALLLGGSSASRPVGDVLLRSSGMVLTALLASRWLKISLHLAFGVYAVLWLWPTWGSWVGLILMLPVAWSRLVLKRHTFQEVLVGALLGIAARVF